MSIEQFLDTYGYLAVLVGTFLEGETILVLAGFAAHRGYLAVHWVILAAFFGSLFGDQMFFFLGRWHSKSILKRKPSWKNRVDKSRRLMERFGTPFILIFRFLYGLRTISPFMIGMSSVSTFKFALLNILGAMVWACVVGAGGYFFGNIVNAVMGDVKHYELLAFTAIAIIGTAVWIVYFLRRKKSI